VSGIIIQIIPLEQGLHMGYVLLGCLSLHGCHRDVFHLHSSDGVLVVVWDHLLKAGGGVEGKVGIAWNGSRLGVIGSLLPEEGDIGAGGASPGSDVGHQSAPLAHIVDPPNHWSGPLAFAISLRDIALVDDLGNTLARVPLFASWHYENEL